MPSWTTFASKHSSKLVRGVSRAETRVKARCQRLESAVGLAIRFRSYESLLVTSSRVQAIRKVAIAGGRQEKFLLRLPDVIARVGLPRSSLYAQIANGTFPAPIRIGVRAVAWDSAAINDWIAQRIADANGAMNCRGPSG